MKQISLSIVALIMLAGCLGDEDPGIFGEYTTYNQCLEKPGYSWQEPKYVAWDAFPGCKPNK